MKRCIIALIVCLLLVTPAFASEAGQSGRRHVAATGYYIGADGQVRTWTGDVMELPGRAVDIASGVYADAANSVLNTAVVLEDGRLYVWGHNRDGCLIPGESERIETPTQVPGIENALSVSLGDGTGWIVLTSDGAVYTREMAKPGPKRVELPAAAAAICRSGGYAAITADGALYEWDAGDDAVPAHVDLPPVRAVSRGKAMTAAVTEDGTLYTWGSDWGVNGYNQLGRGAPGIVDFNPGAVEIPNVGTAAVGCFFYAAAVDGSGALWQWGSTARSAGENITHATDSKAPAVLAEHLPFQQLVLGAGQSAGVTAGEQLYTWGWNSRGELGSGTGSYVAYPALAAEDAAFCSGVPFAGSKDNLQSRYRAYDGRFLDVSEHAWYAQEVADAYALGLIDGMSDTGFAPESPLRLSEAIAMAVKAYERYTGNDETIENGSLWYAPYVHRAIAYGIVGVGEFSDYTAFATRAETAAIFSRALPAAELAPVCEKSAPDVSPSDPYAAEIDLLYKAGVLKGNDDAGTFDPARELKRAEAAAICLRLMR